MKNMLPNLLLLLLCAMNQTANAQWVSKASGFSTPQRGIVELIAIGNNVVWGIGADGINPIDAPINDFTRTTDGGKHWIAGNVNAFPDYTLVGIAPLSATLCYGSIANFDSGNSKIVKTTDGGKTWTEQLNYDFGAEFGFFADIYFFNSNEGLVYGDQSNGYFTIFTTKDGGKNWKRVPKSNLPAGLPDESSYVFSSEGIDNTFWTVSSLGRIWKTKDKGLHWSAYATEQDSIEFSNLKMRDELHGLWGVHGELYRTSDGGVTWTEVETSGTWFTNDLAYVPGTASTYVSTGGHDFPGYAENGSLHGIGTSYSVDDGNTWITIDTGVEHLSLAMVNAYTGFTGGLNQNSSSKGIFMYDGPALGYSCYSNLTTMCHNGHTVCVSNNSISMLLEYGYALGACMSNFAVTDIPTSNTSLPNNTLNAYPNPADGQFTLELNIPERINTNTKIQVVDMLGKIVYTESAEMNNGVLQKTIFTPSTLANGLYLAKVIVNNNIYKTQLILEK